MKTRQYYGNLQQIAMKESSSIPLFFEPGSYHNGQALLLQDSTAKHVALVLRKKNGDQIRLTNGRGLAATATITNCTKKQVAVCVDECTTMPQPSGRKTAVAIAPVKNTNRLEWFLEKAAELGVADIFLIQTGRTEKTHLRYDRLEQILISAMLQSNQYHLCRLHAMQSLQDLLQNHGYHSCFIAHCMPGEKNNLSGKLLGNGDALVLIGPEGDFTAEEVEACMHVGCEPVSLGDTRLRTETAALTAAVLCRQLD